MVYSFNVKTTLLAKTVLGEQRVPIVKEIITAAEKLELGENDYAIYDLHDLELKVIVRFASRTIHIMSKKEADEIDLPKPR